MSAPSRTTRPAEGLSSRDSPRSSVDLPHAFGPTIIVNDLSGIDTDRPSLMTRLSYPMDASSTWSREPAVC